MNRKILLILILFIGLSVCAQHANFNTQRNWSLHKKELQIGFGATQFNGDLGGSVGVGRDYSLKDIDMQATGYAGWVGYRQRFHPYFATTSSLCVFQLKGNDKWSEEPTRNSRNLNFQSLCFEVQQRLEFIFAANEKFGSMFNLPGNYSKTSRSQQYYVFAGVGMLYFNPKSELDGKMMALRPLKTEGQSSMYSPFTLTIPTGVGFRIGLSRMWRVGLELAYVKTFSDYVDDVSTIYANPSQLNSPEAIHFANPALGNPPAFNPGEKRGDPNQKDAYYHVNVILTKNLTYRDYGRQRKRYNLKSSGRYKV